MRHWRACRGIYSNDARTLHRRRQQNTILHRHALPSIRPHSPILPAVKRQRSNKVTFKRLVCLGYAQVDAPLGHNHATPSNIHHFCIIAEQHVLSIAIACAAIGPRKQTVSPIQSSGGKATILDRKKHILAARQVVVPSTNLQLCATPSFYVAAYLYVAFRRFAAAQKATESMFHEAAYHEDVSSVLNWYCGQRETF